MYTRLFSSHRTGLNSCLTGTVTCTRKIKCRPTILPLFFLFSGLLFGSNVWLGLHFGTLMSKSLEAPTKKGFFLWWRPWWLGLGKEVVRKILSLSWIYVSMLPLADLCADWTRVEALWCSFFHNRRPLTLIGWEWKLLCGDWFIAIAPWR